MANNIPLDKRTISALLITIALIAVLGGIAGLLLGINLEFSQEQEQTSTTPQEPSFPEAPPDFEEEEVTPDPPPEPVADDIATVDNDSTTLPTLLTTTAAPSTTLPPPTTSTTSSTVPPTTVPKKTQPAKTQLAKTPAPQKKQETSSTKKRYQPLPPTYLAETKDTPWLVINPMKTSDYATSWRPLMIRQKNRLHYLTIPEDVLAKRPSMQWQMVQEGNNLQAKFNKSSGKYALQVLSIESDRIYRAIEAARLLMNDGYYTYLIRSEDKINGHYWYRVRVGFFTTTKIAKDTGREIFYRYRDLRLFPKNYWPVLPNESELGPVLDLNMHQRQWVVELPQYDSVQKATVDFEKVNRLANFAYIAQQQDSPTSKPRYRMRLGFFGSRSAARQVLEQLRLINLTFAQSQLLQL